MWRFRNDEKSFADEDFRPKSAYNPRNKDTVIETYLSSLEERLLDIFLLKGLITLLKKNIMHYAT